MILEPGLKGCHYSSSAGSPPTLQIFFSRNLINIIPNLYQLENKHLIYSFKGYFPVVTRCVVWLVYDLQHVWLLISTSRSSLSCCWSGCIPLSVWRRLRPHSVWYMYLSPSAAGCTQTLLCHDICFNPLCPIKLSTKRTHLWRGVRLNVSHKNEAMNNVYVEHPGLNACGDHIENHS